MLEDTDFQEDDLTPTPDKKWWSPLPANLSLQQKLYILQKRAIKIRHQDDEGKALRLLLEDVEAHHAKVEEELKKQWPCAYFIASYEQSLLLNAWWCGIDFPVCFSANRIGKTAAFVINVLLWILQNIPDWPIFHPPKTPDLDNPDEEAEWIENPHQQEGFYIDRLARPVQILPRPNLARLKELKAFLREHPELIGDPTKSHLEGDNRNKFASLQQLCSAMQPAYPDAPIKENGTIWLGAPDTGFHDDIVMKEWKRWTPPSFIKKWVDSERYWQINNDTQTNFTPTVHEIICKSYESTDTVWAGAAVTAVVLTEGLSPAILSEVRQRIRSGGFGSWDYTPYEARNVGAKTALAYRVHKGEEQLPLKAYVFTRFSARKAPVHILPLDKRDDLIRMWDGKKEGEARLDGVFYSSSPLVLAHLNRTFHCVPWTREELFERYPSGQIYRGLDPGYDHPTVCAWALLAPGNMWFFYRYYVQRQTTISERCRDIVRLSGNTLIPKKWGKGPDAYNLIEYHLSPDSEAALLTAADYHLFKTDENTGASYSNNYIKAGLSIVESTHMAPEDRAINLDNKLDISHYHVHPITQHTPGARVFFLINGPGVSDALGKMEALFWERLAGGPNKGEAKDTVPTHGDDELDATCYLACGPYVWTNVAPVRRLRPNFDDLAEFEKNKERFLQACNS